jgi:hypothetical protein
MDAVQDVQNYPGNRSLAALRTAYDATAAWPKRDGRD